MGKHCSAPNVWQLLIVAHADESLFPHRLVLFLNSPSVRFIFALFAFCLFKSATTHLFKSERDNFGTEDMNAIGNELVRLVPPFLP